ncbi:MAG TPA: retropepsin-like aspartic protease [Pirellulaceae bacterium]|jgi:aspartyl protease family protein
MRYVFLLIVGFVAAPLVLADELSDARSALEGLGIRASSTGVVLVKEAELTKELNKAPGLKRNVLQSEKELKATENNMDAFERGLVQLRLQHVQFSAQLANINPNDITLNNKLVSAIKVLEGQLDLAREHKRLLDAETKNSRVKSTEAREAYIGLALSARQLAGEIEEDYAKKAADADAKGALARYNKAAGKQFMLAATPGFQANMRRLKQIEDTVLSDSIDLRDDGGKTLRVNVVVNGRYPQEMVLDSGASLISLPPSVAAKFGLKPSDKDPKIVLLLADGREINGRLMKLPSVRVGKFQVDNIECAVLGDEAYAAEPLLGMSFLEHFKFEIDSAAKKLTMVKISGTEGAVGKK